MADGHRSSSSASATGGANADTACGAGLKARPYGSCDRVAEGGGVCVAAAVALEVGARVDVALASAVGNELRVASSVALLDQVGGREAVAELDVEACHFAGAVPVTVPLRTNCPLAVALLAVLAVPLALGEIVAVSVMLGLPLPLLLPVLVWLALELALPV
jgi:hypothetical protein